MAGPLPFTRRRLLVGGAATAATAFTAVGGLASCGGSSDESGGDASPGAAGSGVPTTRHAARLRADPFTLGVASGDPLADRVVLWTRLAPMPLAGGLAGMPDDPVDVVWQVATDQRFSRVVIEGVAVADPANVHAVHVDADGLDPLGDYFYRFTVGEWRSPVGHTRTAAEPGSRLEQLRLAVLCCQLFGTGYYAAYRHLLDEDLDVVVHLGDYVYEQPIGNPDRPVVPETVPVSLDDYRLRYASYRVDANLQTAHARYPFLCMWDDHEVVNNYAADTEPGDSDTTTSMRARRAAAYRAYWEHLPLRLSPPDGPDVTLYRSATFGDLAQLYLLDERQYADEPPCRDSSVSDLGNCPARGSERQYLGDDQDRWLATALGESRARWNLVGNPTVVAGVNMGSASNPTYYLETWDGYPAARRRFLDRLADDDVANPVVLTGDWHEGMVNDVHLDPEDPGTAVVATELMAPAVSSPLYDAPGTANPHIRHQVLRHGYLTVQVEPERLTARFRVLDDVGQADAAITTDSTWEISDGNPRATRRG
ncbi:MAG: alkaline phosphatase D family protein [Acidimicrobiales bacterium]